MSIAHDLNANMVIGLIEQAELFIGIDLNQKAHQCRQNNSNKNAYRFKQYRCFLV